MCFQMFDRINYSIGACPFLRIYEYFMQGVFVRSAFFCVKA